MVLGGFVRTTTAASLLVLATGLGAVAYSPPPSLVGFFGVLLVGVGFGAFAVTLFAILSSWSPNARTAPDDEAAADRPTGPTSGPTPGPTSGPTEEFVRGGSGGTSTPITAAGKVEVAGSSSPLEALESTLESDEPDQRAVEAASGDDDRTASRDEADDGEEAERNVNQEDAEGDVGEDEVGAGDDGAGDDGAGDDGEDDDGAGDDGEDDDGAGDDGAGDDGEDGDDGGFVWASHRPDDPEPTPGRGRSNGGNEILDASGDRSEPEEDQGAVKEDDGGMVADTGAEVDADQEADPEADQEADPEADQEADPEADQEADPEADEGPDEDDFLWDDPSDR